ncbi:MAG TPA: hypothetical protein VEF04_19675 [Blastocatellia bacterium]|nr:hypothetical protein [Blastocatellia bacterium]
MSETNLEKVIADIRALSHEEQDVIRRLLNEEAVSSQPIKLPITPRIIGTYTPKDRSKEWAWLAQHRKEYENQWVALNGDLLISSGTDFKAVHNAAKQAGVPHALIVHVETDIPFAGF